jgi:hypothetical protein
MRILLLATFVAALTAVTAASASADSLVTYACTPPASQTAGNCAIWHTTPVTLYWGWPASYNPTVLGDCTTPHTFTTDTAGTDVQCVVQNAATKDIQFATATIRLDQTPPVVTGMAADRPPDHDGWWNHPVNFTFTGTDATSGIATCDTVNFAGPDSALAPVTGSCTDVAGNKASGTFPVKYDATPPTVAPGSADAPIGQISLTWTTSPDAVSTSVMRSPGIGGAPASEVYSGPGHSLTDSAVVGGETYTYTINASDPAANVASTTMTVKAKAVPQASPAAKGPVGPPLLDWPRVKGADYYNVQLFRNGRKILSAWPRRSQLQLQRQWHYAGKARALAPGTYRWYAWAGFGRRAQHHYGKLIVTRRFKIAAPATGKSASRG